MTDRPGVGVVPVAELRSYDGLSFLKALIAGALPRPPITETLGFELVEAERGRVAFNGEPQFRHYNPIGMVHAGFAAALLDSAVASAVHSTLAKGETYTTLELKLNLVHALTSRIGTVRAEGRVIHRGHTVATAEGDLRDKEGRLYAHATTTCLIFPARTRALKSVIR